MEKCVFLEVVVNQLKQIFDSCEIAIHRKGADWHISAKGAVAVIVVVGLGLAFFIR